MNKTNALYVVATPIGNLEDISCRAIRVLKEVDVIAAEDTRHSQKLLNHFAISTAVISCHLHNEALASKQIVARLQEGQSVALISDAGTPLISDPGYLLVKRVIDKGFLVHPVPGPCALISALSVSAIDSRRFVFEGFLPAKRTKRQSTLKTLEHEIRTMIFYEAPHRICACVEDMKNIFGAKRLVTLAREMSKRFEEVSHLTLGELSSAFAGGRVLVKGEMVLVVTGASASKMPHIEGKHLLNCLPDKLSKKEKATIVAKATATSKREWYQYLLDASN